MVDEEIGILGVDYDEDDGYVGWDQVDEAADDTRDQAVMPDLPASGAVGGWGAFAAGRELVVTIELPGGQVYQGKALMASLSMDAGVLPYDVQGPRTWDMTLSGIGELQFEDHARFMRRVREQRRRWEWLCRFCGGVAEGAKCPHCNAVRTVLLE